MGFVEWNNLVLYPKGPPVSQLYYQPAFRLPVGWTSATALDSVGASAEGIEYSTVSLETLIDSPVLAGAYTRRLPLGSLFGAPVEANIYCSSPDGLDYKPEFEKRLQGIVREAGALFGARHFDHYRFLIGLGELQGDLTLEHHQSHIYVAPERALLDLGPAPLDISSLGHEWAHSWCGKYRRPTGLTFTDYQHAENAELLWVYEGLDQYLGYLLNGRSGMFTAEPARMQFIRAAVSMSHRTGRSWRNLRDTAISTGPLRDATTAGFFWRRAQDYYTEGALIWLEADATIRRLSGGRKSLDDFCRSFFGGANTGAEVNPYSEAQVVAALNTVQPFDWGRFLDERVDGIDTPEPARALAAAGWRFSLADTADAYETAAGAHNDSGNLTYSLGIATGDGGAVADVIPDGPAGRAGLAAGMKIIGVDGNSFSKQAMTSALKAAQKTAHPMELLVTWGAHYRTYLVDCHTGPQYPAGERIAGRPDVLSQILHVKPVAATLKVVRTAPREPSSR